MAEQNIPAKTRREETGNPPRTGERRPMSSGILRRDPLWSHSEYPNSPFGLMRRFADNMDRAFSSDWGPEFGNDRTGTWSPAIDVWERDGKVIVHADLPGLKREDVKVEVVDNALVIQGERRMEHEETQGGYRRSERRYGSFYRSIPLPEEAQMDQARAEFKDGVLEVSMPVSASQRRREVPIEGSERKEVVSENPGQTRVSKAG